MKLTKLKAQGCSLARAASKTLGGAQQCPKILQLTYETNLVEVSPNWTTTIYVCSVPLCISFISSSRIQPEDGHEGRNM